MKDLFETPNELPQNVQDVLSRYEEGDFTYNTCEALKRDLNAVGYTCDYGLDASPYNLTKITNKKLGMDDIRDISIQIVDKMVADKLIEDCIDTDDETEFEVQDVVSVTIAKILSEKYPTLIDLEDEDIKDLLE